MSVARSVLRDEQIEVEPEGRGRVGSRVAMNGLVVVANRLPVDIDADGGATVSPGGLVSALSSVTGEGTRWVGWGGLDSPRTGVFDHRGLHLHPVVLSANEVDRCYQGFSNSVIWPLFHGRLRPVHLDRSWWHSYRVVNERFAAAVAQCAPLGGTVWVHDYHLLLAPAMIRALRPDLRIGLFLHIPFPDARMFSMLPWRAEIIDGMLRADVLGFQGTEAVENFVAAADLVADVEVGDGMLEYGSHVVEVGAFPISIDFAAWDRLGDQVGATAQHHRRELGVESIFLGIDRLDYTKGIPHRLRAFGELLDERQLSTQSCAFVQVGAPTRTHITAYQQERDEVDALIRTINTRHPRADGSVPVRYIDASLDETEIAAWYRAADALVVTSLADGMNLVAKEFVAARKDLGASVILSEFAGASQDLDGALIVNPYDIEEIKRALVTAVNMPAAARRARMQSMRGAVRSNDVHHWAGDFLSRLESTERATPLGAGGRVSAASTGVRIVGA